MLFLCIGHLAVDSVSVWNAGTEFKTYGSRSPQLSVEVDWRYINLYAHRPAGSVFATAVRKSQRLVYPDLSVVESAVTSVSLLLCKLLFTVTSNYFTINCNDKLSYYSLQSKY